MTGNSDDTPPSSGDRDSPPESTPAPDQERVAPTTGHGLAALQNTSPTSAQIKSAGDLDSDKELSTKDPRLAETSPASTDAAALLRLHRDDPIIQQALLTVREIPDASGKEADWITPTPVVRVIGETSLGLFQDVLAGKAIGVCTGQVEVDAGIAVDASQTLLNWLATPAPMGLNPAAETLCLLHGFVRWQLNDESGLPPALAPILALPIHLRPQHAQPDDGGSTSRDYQMVCFPAQSQPLLNPSLSMLMQAAGRETLPPLSDDLRADMAQIKSVIEAGRLDWKVDLWTGIARLPVSALFASESRDSGASSNAVSQQPLPNGLSDLLNQTTRDGEAIAAEYNLDRLTVDALPPLVLEADSSAHSVLLDVFKDASPQVVLGLPGTGKTQPAEPLLGAALLKNRRVLVTAPDKTDLDRLLARLKAANLSDCILDLTAPEEIASSAGKAEGSSQDADETAETPPADGAPASGEPEKAIFSEWRTAAAAVEELRRPLARYARLIHTIHDDTGKTPYQILWQVERMRQSVAVLPRKALPAPGTASPKGSKSGVRRISLKRVEHPSNTDGDAPPPTPEQQLENQRALIRAFETEMAEYKSAQPIQGDRSLAGHAWDGFIPRDENPDSAGLARALDRIAVSLKGVSDALRTLRKEADAHFPQTESTARALTELARTLPPVPAGAALELLPGIAAPGRQAALQEIGAMLTEYAQQKAVLDRVFGSMWQGFDIATVEEAVSMKDEVLGAMLPGTPVSRAAATAQEFTRHAMQIQHGLRHFSDCAGALGVGFSASPANAQLMLSVLSLAAAAPKDALKHRCEELQYPEAASVLSSARKAATALMDREGKLAQTFDLMALPDGETIAAAAWRLHGSGMLSSFNAEWREAKQLYLSMRTAQASGDKAPSVETMAKQLAELAQWRWESERFAADEHYRVALGPAFNGLMTDFDKLDRLVTWHRRLQDALITSARGTGADQVAAELREAVYNTLVTAEPQRLIALSELYAAAQTSLIPLLSVTEPQRRIQEDSRKAEVVKRAATILSDLGVLADAMIGDVFSTLEGVVTAQKLKHLEENDPRAGSLLRGRYKGIDTDFGPVESARTWAHSVTRISGLPQKLALWLLTPDAAHRASWLTERLDTAAQHFALYKQQRDALTAFGTVDWERFSGGARNRLMHERGYGENQQVEEITLTDMATRMSAAKAAIHLLPHYARLCANRRRLLALGLGDVVKDLEAGAIPPGRAERMLDYAHAVSLAEDMLRSWPELMEFDRHQMSEIRRSYRTKHNALMIATQRLAGAVASRSLEGASTTVACPIIACVASDIDALIDTGSAPFDLALVLGAERLQLSDALPALQRAQQAVYFGNPASIDVANSQNPPLLTLASQAYRPAQALRWDHRTLADGLSAPLSLCPAGDILVRFPAASTAKATPSILVERSRNQTVDDALASVVTQLANQFASGPYATSGPQAGGGGQSETEPAGHSASSEASVAIIVADPKMIGIVRQRVQSFLQENPEYGGFTTAEETGVEPLVVVGSSGAVGIARDRIIVFAAGYSGVTPEDGDTDDSTEIQLVNQVFGRAREHLTVVGDAEDPMTERIVRMITDSTTRQPETVEEKTSRARGQSRERLPHFHNCIAAIVKQYGLQADAMVGAGPFKIDIAVRDPRKPGKYLLGIMGDGVSLNTMRATNDRDLLLEKRLKALGWNLHIISSLEWFRDPIAAEDALAQRLARLLSGPTVKQG